MAEMQEIVAKIRIMWYNNSVLVRGQKEGIAYGYASMLRVDCGG